MEVILNVTGACCNKAIIDKFPAAARVILCRAKKKFKNIYILHLLSATGFMQFFRTLLGFIIITSFYKENSKGP
ncbi:hypothetical protein [Desulfitibacter alkalitolerans]|uniref:hypothetical protein n=1 Tax=Desulfitibacter alkalitolerans TaxID=264641 RepID=UPI000486E540|nr:hypothetical protein [Desulfitibacter alkalitolerans]